MDAWFELFDHTADMGLRIRASTMPELIPPATSALYAAIGELRAVAGEEPFRFDGAYDNAAVLLRDYLGELLSLFERDGRIIDSFESVEFGNGRLAVRAMTVAVDDERTIYAREVKAITYHELAIREIEGGYEAALIVDI